ncbi:2-amino-4-hydroxy-6-hydroxymethyldihydropteridine diphosphokinase [Paenibacillus psychroresistens]|uniref:2-amino-4-hydroxy-6-hydroxymethyldihydropteridine diphosphokinase n=1 Tax=Paenibacillus psychroresistens TaxID=1778678 RepID=A0A6B8RDW6_9BACL|nr:2-amino-4-hydroxy-6-hydroxymethyldihydropteridine diphosphokinase [Paenibacillus psychroresistens]QGQ93715.1 2-amino-4-hydroxy-6-hydroxymethyldihydropteridine diphosphokinase [Paenibacillus psychroresistens]
MDSTQVLKEFAYIGLGSNIEDREFYLAEAIRLLQENPDIQISRCSSIYETDPVGYTDQAAFLNRVIKVETNLKPSELFKHMLSVEQLLGRVRDIRFGPRTIDLDLLLYGHHQLDQPELLVPHPRMAERAFVLIPLLEIADENSIPAMDILKHNVTELAGKEGVKLWITNNN